MGKYENEARMLCEAIKRMADSENALRNFEDYLSIHFDKWLEDYAFTPSNMAVEFETFSNIQ